MDVFGHNKASMLSALEEVREKANRRQKNIDSGQSGLFDSDIMADANQLQDTFPQIPELPKAELLNFEKELFGLYLTEHPMKHALDKIKEAAQLKLGDIDGNIHKDKSVLIGGIVASLRKIYTKRGNKE